MTDQPTTQLINDTGFVPDDWPLGFSPWGEAASDAVALDIPADADPASLPLTARAMRIDFPSSGDGRGFTIARTLRLRGYTGRLRARGAVLADQYAMARRAGFDEIEIPATMAARQPEDQWLFRADWQDHDYQARLRG